MSRSPRLLRPAVTALCALVAPLLATLGACVISSDLEGLSDGDRSPTPAEGGGGDSGVTGQGDGAMGSDAAGDDDATVDAPPDAPIGCTLKTTAARLPGAVAVSGGGQPWSNPANARVSDGVVATASLTTADDQSQFLTASSLGFTIPSTAQVRGITVTIVAKGTAADPSDVRDESLRLAPNGSPAGANKANARYTSGLLTRTYGGPSDLWGVAGLTPAIVNGAGFGLWLSVRFHGTGNATADVDAMTIAVTTCE